MGFERERSVGNAGLERFDVLVVGSGSGGSAAAEVLARAGQRVLVLEAGPNWFRGLGDPDPARLGSVFSNDEIKFRRRHFLEMDPLVEPRSFRRSEAEGVRSFVGGVNTLPKLVGGGATHSNLTTVRFEPHDFELGGRLGDTWSDASFADWPLAYEELEPFYQYAERRLGVQGDGAANPYEPPRSAPFPMRPGPDKALGEKLGEAARRLGLSPYLAPHAINSRPYDGRPPCAGCGFCGEFGCPTQAKGSPAVTTLRRALLSGRALLLSETRVMRLLLAPGGRKVLGVEALDPDGRRVEYRADRCVLAASPIEDVRLLWLSGDGGPVGNSSGLVGRNLMFHLLTTVAGVLDQRLHPERGKTVATGFADFRGRPGDPGRPLGGLVLAGDSPLPVREALLYARIVRGRWLASWLRQSPMRERMLGATMYGEDAPQPSNRVDLDPELVDLDGLPAPRITYRSHAFERSAQSHYAPKLAQVVREAGARHVFWSGGAEPSESRHIMGTLRFGLDPARSVCDRTGRFHDLENLYAADGSLFPSSSGYNPILTITAVGAWVGASMLDAERPTSRLS